ncbi:MAG: hypothetical protein ACJ0DI_05055 [bacterium]
MTKSDTALNITSAENMLIVKSGYSLLSSNDEGATWKRFETYADTMVAGSSSQKPSLIYFNNYYYFITQELADNQYSGKGLGIFRTSDGTVWQNVYKNSDQINNIFKFDKIYAVGNNGLLAYSSDGINWTTKRLTGNSLYQIFDVSD